MKKILLSVFAILFFQLIVIAQKASNVLENGIPVKSGHRLILKYDLTDKVIKFDLLKEYKAIDPAPLSDSILFLVRKTGLNVYLRPLNPLNYSTNTELKTITDPINQEAAKALGSIIDLLGTFQHKPVLSYNAASEKDTQNLFKPCFNYNIIELELREINTILQDDQKKAIVRLFKALRGLSFEDEESTATALSEIEISKLLIEKHFADLDSILKVAGKRIKGYNCNNTGAFVTQYVFNLILRDFTNTCSEQEKRLKNLQAAFTLVSEAKAAASKGGGTPDLPWCTQLGFVSANEGKISLFTVNLNESGYTLSDKDEIVTTTPKALTRRTIRVRKYQLFVPEVSVGTAYTTFTYNTYGTTTDLTGQQFIASPVENTIRNLKFTSMINFNLYIPNSSLHPLWQMGIGVNSDVPTLLTGVGLRININGLKRLAVTGGVAMTWIKELDKLKVGDKVSGTSDINKDLKYQFSWPPKPYIGIQYNF